MIHHIVTMKYLALLLVFIYFFDFASAAGVNVAQKIKKVAKKKDKGKEGMYPYQACNYEMTADGHKWKYYAVEMNYWQAVAYCAMDGAALVSIPDQQTDDQLAQFMADSGHASDDIYIGLMQTGNYKYTWNNGMEFTVDPGTGVADAYENFHMDEDKDIGPEDGKDDDKADVCFEKEDDGEMHKWEDDACDSMNYFVCECLPVY